jgi:tetratricopeptide (TPR) repeat protein
MKAFGVVLAVLLATAGAVWGETNPAGDKTPQEYFNEGSKYINAEEFDRAVEIYNEGLGIFPNNSSLLSALAFIHYRKGNLEDATNLCNRAINSDGNNEMPFRVLGYVYSNKEDWNSAVRHFTQAITLDSTKRNSYESRGRCYMNLREYLKAIDDFRKAIELGSNDDNVYAYLAALLYNERSYSEAISFANRTLEINPDNSIARTVLNTAEENGISISERGTANLDVSIRIGWTMDDYLKGYTYLQADSLDTLIDRRGIDAGIFFVYKFDQVTQKLSSASLEDYSDDRINKYSTYLTEWIKAGNDLRESNESGVRTIVNMTPHYQDDELSIFQSLILSSNKLMLLFIIVYNK